MKKKRYVCALIIILAVFFTPSCVYGVLGYSPIQDPLGYDDSYLYKRWCEEMFENGCFVYEGYKKIAFDIEYAPELPNTDYWKTPFETVQSGKGDCEDAMLLFIDFLAYSQSKANIVWGWVGRHFDNEVVEDAHVWVELIGRDGNKYVVEGFSKSWNGIIPIDVVVKSETRRPIFKLSCLEFNKLSDISSQKWSIHVDDKEIWVFGGNGLKYGHGYMTSNIIFKQDRIDIGHNKKKEVERILNKLHKYLIRRNSK